MCRGREMDRDQMRGRTPEAETIGIISNRHEAEVYFVCCSEEFEVSHYTTFNQGECETRRGRFKEMSKGKVYSYQPVLGKFDI